MVVKFINEVEKDGILSLQSNEQSNTCDAYHYHDMLKISPRNVFLFSKRKDLHDGEPQPDLSTCNAFFLYVSLL